MIRLGFISCSFELRIWFIMEISAIALLLAWTPAVSETTTAIRVDSALSMGEWMASIRPQTFPRKDLMHGEAELITYALCEFSDETD